MLQLLARILVQDINVQLALLAEASKGEIAAAEITDRWTDRILSEK